MWDVWIHILGIGAECACWGAGGPVCRPYGGNVASPGGAPSRRALQKGCLEPAPSSAPFGGTFPLGGRLRKIKKGQVLTCPLKHRGETQFRIKFLCFLSFSKKGSPGSEEPGFLAYCFSSGPLVSQPRGFLMAAWAAASRAMGTRKGEQDT